MSYLAIDTSGTHLTIVLIKNGEVFTEFMPDGNLKHSITLMPAVEKILDSNNVKVSEIDGFACVIGPGSFTGIRIGVATVKALAYAFKKPVLAVTSFDVLAYNKRVGKRLAVIDAMHDNYYVAGYDGDSVTIAPCFLEKAEVIKLSTEYEVLSSTDIELITAKNANLLEGLIAAVQNKVGEFTLNLDALNPLYVRKSQAEEGRV